jgi:hypothetical protein
MALRRLRYVSARQALDQYFQLSIHGFPEFAKELPIAAISVCKSTYLSPINGNRRIYDKDEHWENSFQLI